MEVRRNLQCFFCNATFKSFVGFVGTRDDSFATIINLTEQCPNCGAYVHTPSGFFSIRGFHEVKGVLLDKMLQHPDPVEFSRELLAVIRSTQDDALAAVEQLSEMKGMEWVRNLFPKDREEQREDARSFVEYLLLLITIVLQVCSMLSSSSDSSEDVRREVERQLKSAGHSNAQSADALKIRSYHIVGLERSTMYPTTKLVQASSVDDARRQAAEMGIIPKQVWVEN